MNQTNLDVRHYVEDPASPRRAEHPDGTMRNARLLFVVVLRGPRTATTRMGIQHRFA